MNRLRRRFGVPCRNTSKLKDSRRLCPSATLLLASARAAGLGLLQGCQRHPFQGASGPSWEAWPGKLVQIWSSFSVGNLVRSWKPGQNSFYDSWIIANRRNLSNIIVPRPAAKNSERSLIRLFRVSLEGLQLGMQTELRLNFGVSSFERFSFIV